MQLRCIKGFARGRAVAAIITLKHRRRWDYTGLNGPCGYYMKEGYVGVSWGLYEDTSGLCGFV